MADSNFPHRPDSGLSHEGTRPQASRQDASAVAPAVISATNDAGGHLGYTTDQELHREAAALPLDVLITRLRDELDRHAEEGRRVDALVEIAQDELPNSTDCDKTEAAIYAMPPVLRTMDSRVCRFSAYFDVLIDRARSGTPGEDVAVASESKPPNESDGAVSADLSDSTRQMLQRFSDQSADRKSLAENAAFEIEALMEHALDSLIDNAITGDAPAASILRGVVIRAKQLADTIFSSLEDAGSDLSELHEVVYGVPSERTTSGDSRPAQETEEASHG